MRNFLKKINIGLLFLFVLRISNFQSEAELRAMSYNV